MIVLRNAAPALSRRRQAAPCKKLSGFSFIELMFVLAIMAILAVVAVPMVQHNLQRDKEYALRNALLEIRGAIDAYKRANEDGRTARKEGESAYPKQLSDLVTGVADPRNPSKANIQFLRRLPRDPFANENAGAVDSWGIRSSTSSGDDPQEGDDVFDVYSRSNAVGLNGIPVNQW